MKIHAFAPVVSIFLTLIIALASLAKPSAMRTVHFPKQSLGKAHIMSSDAIYLGSINGPFIGSASGNYSVPVNEKVVLYLDPRVAENPALLKDMAPDAVYAIRLLYSDTPESFLPAISKLSGLHRLDMRECSVSENGLAQLAQLKNLERLTIENCDFQGDYGKGLLKIKSLRYLSLAGNRVTPSTMALISQLPNLEYLCLARCALSNECLNSIGSCKQLKNIDLSSNAAVTAAGLNYLKACPKLVALRFPFTAIKAHDLLLLKGLHIDYAELHENNPSPLDVTQLKKTFPGIRFAVPRREPKADEKMLFAPTLR